MGTRPFIRVNEIYNEHTLDRGLNRSKNPLSVNDVKLINEFVDRKKIKQTTRRNIISKLAIFRGYLPQDFTVTTIKQLESGLNKVSGSKNTTNAFKGIVKEFFSYLIDEGKTEITERELKRIKKERVESHLCPADLLTEEEIQNMIQTTKNPMHKALIAVTAESGGRAHEIGNMRWGDITFDQYGVRWSLKSDKTGKPLYVRLIESLPYLVTLQNLAGNHLPEDHVFTTRDGKPLIYETFRIIIKRIGEDAGIKKKVNPHIFRHTRVTDLLQKGMHTAELSKTIWGGVSSQMLKRYEHISAEDIDREIKRINGVEDVAVKKPKMIICPHCQILNPAINIHCHACGINLKTAQEQESEMEKMKKQMSTMAGQIKAFHEIMEKVNLNELTKIKE